MEFKEDIASRITADFGERASEALAILTQAIAKTDYLKTDRVIRCIVFLSKGKMEDLNKFINIATYDTRDVMLWAEYERIRDGTNYKRMRDFNHTFDECTVILPKNWTVSYE